MINTYTYDSENQLTSLDSYAGVFNFEYDDLSRMTKMMLTYHALVMPILKLQLCF